MMPVPMGASHSFSPLSALYAAKRPSAVPAKTRLPAVVRVPPFHGAVYSWRHASFCLTGSHATRRPKALLLGGWVLISMPVFQPVPDCGWPGTLALCCQALSSARLRGTFCTGK